TQLAQMARLVEDAQNGKAQVQRLADRVSGVFVPVVIALAVGTLGFWLGTGGSVAPAFTTAGAGGVLPLPSRARPGAPARAPGRATATAVVVGRGRGAQLGILIKGREVLESTRRIDTIVLDKTGTVTTGRMTLTGVITADGEDPEEVRRLAGALEDSSEHPIAQVIAADARERAGALPRVTDFANVEGLGVRGVVEGRTVAVGRPTLLDSPLPPELERAWTAAEAAGRTAVVAGWDGRPRAVLVVADTIKDTSAGAVRELRSLGLHPILLTGDNESAARAIAAEAG